MKKAIKLGSFLMLITLTLAAAASNAFNPLAHIYIADHACSSCSPKIDYYYGSIAPDIVWYIANIENWPTAASGTHEDYIDLKNFARGSTQMAFARGWLTHGENEGTPGTDYFAHIAYSRSPSTSLSVPGYVIEKAGELVTLLGWDSSYYRNHEFAHYVIETTIDLQLKYNYDPTLPGKLLFANLFRSWEDRNLLMRVFVWSWWERRTGWLTLATAEFTFRQLVNRYAAALILPSPRDQEALAQLGAELAGEMYGLDIAPEFLLNTILPAAIYLCEEDEDGNYEPDYHDVIEEAFTEVGTHLP